MGHAPVILCQGIPNLKEINREKVSGNRLEVDSNSFFGKDKMWRGIEPCLPWKACPFSVSSEKGFNRCTRASFALGTGDMNDI